METVLEYLRRFEYLAMFGILVLCGLGLPIPEEVTLIASGFAVGWDWADYFLSCAACTAGILTGDSIIFAVGRYFGRSFFSSRVVRWFLPKKRQARVRRAFYRHGKKTVFFARFVTGIRIGVYAYAGQNGMRWQRFLFLDFLGCMVSVPTSIWVGKFAAQGLADPEQATEKAHEILGKGHTVLYAILAVLVGSFFLHYLWNYWRDRRVAKKIAKAKADEGALEARGDDTPVASSSTEPAAQDKSITQSAEE